MDLGDILTREQIVTDLQATNRWEAIDELINNLVATNKIKAEHREAVSAVVKKRESSMSTGIGFGIGIPHASTESSAEWRRAELRGGELTRYREKVDAYLSDRGVHDVAAAGNGSRRRRACS